MDVTGRASVAAPASTKEAEREKAIMDLAAALYGEMENLDPSDGRSLGELSERERCFYRFSITSLLQRDARLLLVALGPERLRRLLPHTPASEDI